MDVRTLKDWYNCSKTGILCSLKCYKTNLSSLEVQYTKNLVVHLKFLMYISWGV